MSGSGLLAPHGELHLTLKRGEPYDSWNSVMLAKFAGMRVAHCTPFQASRFPGYAHRRTIGDDHAGEDAIASGKTYAFVERNGCDDEEEQSSGQGKKKLKHDHGNEKNKKGVKGGRSTKLLPTGQTYKDAWKQRHRKAKR